jgi:hypothetical protein
MKVKILALMAGPNGVFPAGSVIEVTRETGAALIAGKYAEAMAEEPAAVWNKPETTDAPGPAETRKRPAVRRGGK